MRADIEWRRHKKIPGSEPDTTENSNGDRYEINFRETVQKVAWLRIDTILSIWNIKAK